MLGGIVAVSHTAGVLALGAVILFAAKTVTPEAIYPYLGVAAGAIVLVIGLRMIAARLRVAPWRFGRSNAADGATGHGHSHGHGGEHRHDSPHEHSHEHPAPHTHVHGVPHSHDDDSGHGHTHHAPVPGATVTWKSLLAIGLADGLVPSASALLIWLAAIGIGREAFGLALVAAFGLGMAAVLTGIGLLLVHGRGLFERRVAPRFHLASRVSAAVPLITALFVAGAGLALVIRAMRQFGVV
jgi:ABC-type nickel/cobalt efflux system permease component RcnA